MYLSVKYWSGGSRAEKAIWALTFLLLVARLLLINWNRAEFTDSIIQLQLFENRNGYFPPLYPAVAKLLAFPFGDPILAGRLVSVIAVSFMVPLVWSLGRTIGGEKVGLWASLLFGLSPVPWRWSLHAMGDGLFACLFLVSLDQSLKVFLTGETQRGERAVGGAFWAAWWGGVATLTRYQGFILLPIGGGAWWLSHPRRRNITLLSVSLIPWLAVAAWMAFWGFVHGEQFSERAPATMDSILKVYMIFAASFLRFAPAAFGFGVCVFAVAGCGWSCLRASRRRAFAVGVLVLVIVWLIFHSAFQSFQYRYFLPLVPLLCVLAACGIDSLGALFRFRLLPLVVVALAAGELAYLTCRALIGTRNTFADFPEAARIVAELPPETPVFSNEIWNPHFLCPKMIYWSGRRVQYAVPESAGDGTLAIKTGRLSPDGEWIWEEVRGQGKVILCLHNVYAPRLFQMNIYHLIQRRWRARLVAQTETYVNTPWLPDIMVAPPVTSLPVAMKYRSRPQPYWTVIIEVDTGTSAADEPDGGS